MLALTYSFLQNGSADTSNFDEEFTREQPTLTPVHGQLSSRDQSEFNGFSWVRQTKYDEWTGFDLRYLNPIGGDLGRYLSAQMQPTASVA